MRAAVTVLTIVLAGRPWSDPHRWLAHRVNRRRLLIANSIVAVLMVMPCRSRLRRLGL